ncbi:hybrid signal transduction histidine kinase M-like, partial [Copidosoma floridanum]|uniref:hybrid signal transduction histidine kinase M-like n=1 Tax=Copidosoma floridanum TaxID=29053 RepID=UPI0006C9BAE4
MIPMLMIIVIVKLSMLVFAELEALVDKLANESQRGSYTIKKNSTPQSPKSPNANSSLIINTQPQHVSAAIDDAMQPLREDTSVVAPTSGQQQVNGNANSTSANNSNDNSSLNNQDDASPKSAKAPAQRGVEELYDIPA